MEKHSKKEIMEEQWLRAYIHSSERENRTNRMRLVKRMTENELIFWLAVNPPVYFTHMNRVAERAPYRPDDTDLCNFLRKHKKAFVKKYEFLMRA